MTSKAGNLLDVPSGAGQVGQAEVTKTVRRQHGHPSAKGEPADHLRPGPFGHWRSTVARRLRQKQGPARGAQAAALGEVGHVEISAHHRIGHDALALCLGRLGPDPKMAPCWIDVTGGQRTQFFPAKRAVVCEGEHQPVAHGLAARCGQQRQPLGFVRNPRQLALRGNQSALPNTPATENSTATATGHRVRRPHTLFDQIVIEQPDNGEPMAYRGVGQARGRAGGAFGVGVQLDQLTYVASDLRTARAGHIDAAATTKTEIVVEAASVGDDGVRSAQQVGLQRHPRARVGVFADVAQRVPRWF